MYIHRLCTVCNVMSTKTCYDIAVPWKLLDITDKLLSVRHLCRLSVCLCICLSVWMITWRNRFDGVEISGTSIIISGTDARLQVPIFVGLQRLGGGPAGDGRGRERRRPFLGPGLGDVGGRFLGVAGADVVGIPGRRLGRRSPRLAAVDFVRRRHHPWSVLVTLFCNLRSTPSYV